MMSDKEKGKKEEEEEATIDHFFHDHPLTLTKAAGSGYNQCYGCRRYIFSGETVYRCRDKCRYPILHEECAEMPQEITLSLHPDHTLIQKEVPPITTCLVCEMSIVRIGYYCSSYDSCKFQIHVGCVQSADITHAAAGERSCMTHPSHPQHELTLLWKPGRAGLLRCDACNTLQRGNFYICIVCQYLIHESCAVLPATVNHCHLHNHPLSLVYRLPRGYIKFDFKCDVCFKELLPKYWVYHCEICRYVVHIKCASSPSPMTMSIIDDNSNVIKLPINNAVEELIQPFVKRLGAEMDENEIKCKFHDPDHQLRLTSTSLLDDQEIEDEEDRDDDDDDDDDEILHGIKSRIDCDGCTTPIFDKKQKSCSSKQYISCSECKYFLHSTCFHLLPWLPSHPLHNKPGHTLTLQTRRPKLDFTYCYVCRVYTNGHMYECEQCSFKADIKCVSLPDTIKHASHPQHLLNLITKEVTREESYWQRACSACGMDTYVDICYRCDTCQIILHSSCCLLPAQVTNPTWDKHTLPLTFDPTANHPSDFYCDVCEEEMNPKRWMYHCRECDVSVHPKCFPAASGEYRNIKFGQRYLVSEVHCHPLVYRLLTGKLHCGVCGNRKDYGSRVFRCDSERCDFFMCLHPCGRNRKDAMLAVD